LADHRHLPTSVEARTQWCTIDDPGSVEARFGLRDCAPTASGNRCAYVVPSWACDAQGRPLAGALMVLADHILGELPYVRRPPDTWSLTAELTLDLIGELPVGGHLFAEAVEVVQGAEAFVQCRITTGAGDLVAVGTTRTVFFAATAQDPVVVTEAASSVGTGAVSIEAVLGIDVHHLAEGVQISLADPGNWVNGFGIMHGGVSACVTELAAAAAVGARNPALATAHVHTNYLRPVVADAPFVAVARLHHIGRSSAVVEVSGRGGRGELCTVSTVTARLPAVTRRTGDELDAV
jgi:uncharacterized protein (TIGR00369 family)